MAIVLPKRAEILRKSRMTARPPKAIAEHRAPPESIFRPIITAVLWRDCGVSSSPLVREGLDKGGVCHIERQTPINH